MMLGRNLLCSVGNPFLIKSKKGLTSNNQLRMLITKFMMLCQLTCMH